MSHPTMTRKDNLMVWGGIYMPRVLGNMAVIAVSSLPPRDRNSFNPNLMYLAILAVVLNILSIAAWVNPRSISSLFGAKSGGIVNSTFLFLASLAVLLAQTGLVWTSSNLYSELTLFVLLSTFFMEVLHVYVVPSDWKFEPYLQDIVWQNFYILFVFLMDCFYMCFISHLFTQGYVVHVWHRK
ncbi:uncharacterized protein LOC101849119 [Aplysia californica]|uniref:Uncharacterized protein LOC101849119 n=1 Tax=Aplysia californica TaxID=6500 RepID=A0ABM1VQP9_APLCA|nr:uncharacterized protein LOC101849119 [Aplysia californica]XP_005094956.1 uncharacterized protein LOC101849119 [Aplysia californica]XP_035824741.1 uncharacterized protein LOC101849119 [Aplysia californica]